MSESAADKKHAPTAQRRKRAREQGHVALSQSLSSHCVLLASLLVLWWSGPRLLQVIKTIMQGSLSTPILRTSPENVHELLTNGFYSCLSALLPLLSCICIAGCMSNWLQRGALFSPLSPGIRWDRVNPFHRLSNTLNAKSLGNLMLGLAKLSVIIIVLAICMYQKWNRLRVLPTLDIAESSSIIWNSLMQTCVAVAVSMLVLGIMDYGIAAWQHEQSLRMTDEELREDNRSSEGDGHVKANRKTMRSEFLIGRRQTEVTE